MVKQTRHIFDLTDVKAIRLRCGHCEKEAVQSIQTAEVPKRCPFCCEEWESDVPNATRSYNFFLVLNMQELLKIICDSIGH